MKAEHIPLYTGHRQRLRKRYKVSEARGMPDYELLELLLTYSIQRKDVKPAAKALINAFGSLARIMDAGPDELGRIPGVGERSGLLVSLVKQFCIRYFEHRLRRGEILSDPDRVIAFCRAVLNSKPNECFMVLYLNVKNEMICHEIVNEGTLDQAVVYPRRILEACLQRHAAAVIIVHNHPSGYAVPSREDKALTLRLKECLKSADILMLDHIITARDEWFSFQKQGIL